MKGGEKGGRKKVGGRVRLEGIMMKGRDKRVWMMEEVTKVTNLDRLNKLEKISK